MTPEQARAVLSSVLGTWRRGRAVTLAWAVSIEASRGDPVAVAWRACADGGLMAALLYQLSDHGRIRVAGALGTSENVFDAVDRAECLFGHLPRARRGACVAAAIRKYVPSLTLSDVRQHDGVWQVSADDNAERRRIAKTSHLT